MQRIFLVRHGQDEDNAKGILNGRRDMPLTELGKQQACDVAKKLVEHGIKVIYSSPLKRAFDTAKIIAGIIGVEEVREDERLVEREFGEMTGRLIADIPKYCDKLLVTDKVTYFLEFPGAEDFPTLLARAGDVLKDIRDWNKQENVLIVTHGDIGKMIRAAFHGWDWERGLKTPYFDNTGVLELSGKQDVIE